MLKTSHGVADPSYYFTPLKQAMRPTLAATDVSPAPAKSTPAVTMPSPALNKISPDWTREEEWGGELYSAENLEPHGMRGEPSYRRSPGGLSAVLLDRNAR